MAKTNGPEVANNFRKLFPKPHIRNVDLRGQSHNVRILRVGMVSLFDTIQNEKQMKLVVWFVNKVKYLVVQERKAEELAKITGTDDPNKWIGKAICLKPGTSRRGKDIWPVVEVHTADPKRPDAPPLPDIPADQKF